MATGLGSQYRRRRAAVGVIGFAIALLAALLLGTGAALAEESAATAPGGETGEWSAGSESAAATNAGEQTGEWSEGSESAAGPVHRDESAADTRHGSCAEQVFGSESDDQTSMQARAEVRARTRRDDQTIEAASPTGVPELPDADGVDGEEPPTDPAASAHPTEQDRSDASQDAPPVEVIVAPPVPASVAKPLNSPDASRGTGSRASGRNPSRAAGLRSTARPAGVSATRSTTSTALTAAGADAGESLVTRPAPRAAAPPRHRVAPTTARAHARAASARRSSRRHAPPPGDAPARTLTAGKVVASAGALLPLPTGALIVTLALAAIGVFWVMLGRARVPSLSLFATRLERPG